MTEPVKAKCVIVVDRSLPLGLIANSSAVLGVALSQLAVDAVGPDVQDASGVTHRGITTIPIAILAASLEEVRTVASAARDCPDIVLIDFNDVAQRSKSYDDYSAKLAACPTAELRPLAVLLFGDKGTIGRLTSRLPLLK